MTMTQQVFIFTTALEGKKPVEQITLLHELQAKMSRHSRTMTLDKSDLTWVLQHLGDFTVSVKQQVMSLLAHLTVSQPWLKLWLSEPHQLNPLQEQIQQFCDNKSPDSRLWNNFLKMLTTCAAKRCAYHIALNSTGVKLEQKSDYRRKLQP